MIHLKTGEERIMLSHEDMNALKRKEAEHIGARLRMIRRINGMDERRFSELVQEESVFIRRFARRVSEEGLRKNGRAL